MPSNEGHIHWDGSPLMPNAYLGQALLISSEDSNLSGAVHSDPIGSLRIKEASFVGSGLLLPNTGFEAIPGTNPVLEAHQPGTSHRDYLEIRQA